MIKRYFIYIFFIFFTFNNTFSQPEKQKKLEQRIKFLNDSFEYEKSINLLNKIINSNANHYDRFYAYLLKSYTYKRLFNYPKTLYTLDLALKEGLKSQRKEEVVNTIDAERCFVYFDKQDYTTANVIINRLRNKQFKHVSISTKAWIIMQEGYIKMLNNKYTQSESLLNEAFTLLKENSPEDLPNIYGKKIELYDKMGLIEQRDIAYMEGTRLAKKYNKIKYEMYLNEVMRNIFQERKDFRNAFFTQRKYDSIVKHYNAIENNAKLELAENKIQNSTIVLNDQQKKYELKNKMLYVIIPLVFFLFISVIAFKLLKKNKWFIFFQRQYDENFIVPNSPNQLAITDVNFTNRQLEIIKYVKEGLTNKEISIKLFISENTVKYHLKIIYKNLGISKRSEI